MGALRDQDIVNHTYEAWSSRTFLTVVKAFCYECMGGTKGEQLNCTAKTCPIFPWKGARSIKAGFREAVELLRKAGRLDLANALQSRLDSADDWEDSPLAEASPAVEPEVL